MRRRGVAFAIALGVLATSSRAFAAPAVDEVDDVDEIDDVDEVDDVDEADDVDAVDESAVVDASATAPMADVAAETTLRVEDVEAPEATVPTEAPPLARLPRPAFGIFGLVQVDFLNRQRSSDQLSDGSGAPLNEDGFALTRGRVGAAADWRYVGVRGVVEFFEDGGSAVAPLTADVHAQLPRGGDEPPWMKVSAGLVRVPFGFELYGETDGERFFAERTTVSEALVPGVFDVGASVSGNVWALHWIAGVYNGQPRGAAGYGLRDPNRAKDYAGRLHLRGDLFRWLEGAVGFSFLRGTGFSAGTPPTKDDFEWVDLNEDGRVTLAELIPVPGTAGRPSENFERWALGADVQLHSELPVLGPLMVYGEFAYLQNMDRGVAIADPVLLGRDLRGLGWYAGLHQSLTRHAGAGVRYDAYYPQLDELEPYDGTVVVTRRRFQSLTASAAGVFRHGPNLRARLLVEYVRSIDNDLGRDANGRPTRLDDDTLRIRAEVKF